MLNALIRWSLSNRRLVLALAAALVAWGGYAAARLPVTVLPDLAAPTVTVVVENPGMAPVDMERLVTFPLETAVSGAPGVRRVRSATALGVAVVWVEFDWGQEIYRARQSVAERTDLVANTWPPGTSRPLLTPSASIMGEVQFLALQSDRHDPTELRTAAETVVRRRLLAIPGVSQVTAIGGGRKQYQVLLSPDKLSSYRVSLLEVADALSAASANTAAGFRIQGGVEYLVHGVGQFTGLDEVRQSAVASRRSVPVYVSDLGAARVGEALKRGEGSLNAAPAVVLGIRKQPSANTLLLTASIDAALGDIEASLPEGMRIHRDVFRQADFVETAISNLSTALSHGGGLVVAVVILFLASVRASLITLLAMPLSLLAAFLCLDLLGLTINAMTLGGLAIAIGELVDDAVIDVENVVRRLRQNARQPPEARREPLHVVYEASREIRGPVVFATVIVTLVFVPLFFLGSVEGLLLRPLGLAYVTALLASLVVALTVTPVLCSYLLPRGMARAAAGALPLVAVLRRLHAPVLRWCLDHSAAVLACSLLLLALALAAFPRMGRSFLPEFNEGALTISAVTLPGTSLGESDRLGSALESALLGVPEVVSTARRTGRAEFDEHLQGVESAEIDVRLALQDRPRAEVLAEIRSRAATVPGTSVNIGQPISHRIDHMLSGSRASVAVKIFGDDLRTLRSLAEQAEEAMRGIPGTVDLQRERQADIPTVSIRFRREALARYGIGAGTAAEALQAAFLGRQAGTVIEGEVAFPLVVRYDGGPPANLDSIRRTVVDTPSGSRVPLEAIAEIRVDRSPNTVTRENAQRKIVVSCNVDSGDLRGVVREIQRRVAEAVRLPPGYRVEYGGQFESEAQATRRILVLSGLVLLGILVLLTSVFDSWADALIVLCNLPFALIGGVAGVFLAGGVLSVASVVGFVTLFGIAARNGILLVSHIRHLLREEGVSDFREAVVRGASERMAPILMTAATTGIALVPVATGLGQTGSEIHAPLALVVVCGLATSTVLNMVVVPAAYWRFRRPGR